MLSAVAPAVRAGLWHPRTSAIFPIFPPVARRIFFDGACGGLEPPVGASFRGIPGWVPSRRIHPPPCGPAVFLQRGQPIRQWKNGSSHAGAWIARAFGSAYVAMFPVSIRSRAGALPGLTDEALEKAVDGRIPLNVPKAMNSCRVTPFDRA